MPTYEVKAPSGKTYTVEGPEGATVEQLGQFILSQNKDERVAMTRAQMAKEFDPTSGMSTGDKFLSGVGRGMSAVGRAVGQGIGKLVGAEAVGAGIVPQASIDEAKKFDAPLMATTAGKVGSITGQVATVAPTALIPGANTYTGAALIGGGTGLATTEGGIGDRIVGAGLGVAGGVAGRGIGRAIGAGFQKLSDMRAATLAAQAPKNALAQEAIQAGYTLPPTEVRPGLVSSAVEGLSGKIKTSQAASSKNQAVTDSLAKKAVGAAQDQPLSVPALDAIRKQAGQAYEAVSQTGTVTPTPAYQAAIDAIAKPFKTAAAGFPNAKPSPMIAELESLKSPSFDASAALAKISELRDAANVAYASQSKQIGKAYKAAASALEDELEQHLQKIGAPSDALKAFREARQLIAKTYSVQAAMNSATGEVSATKLAAQLQKGKPLSGELEQVARIGQAFPKATQALPQNYNAVSPLDYGAALVSGNPLGLVARPGLRAAALSAPVQRMLATQQGNALLELLANGAQSQRLNALIPGAAGVLAPSLQK